MYIVDTNILMSLNSLEKLLEEFKEISIPVEVLYELDKNKTAEGAKGFKCRRAIRNIEEISNKIKFLNKTKEFYYVYNTKTNAIDDIIISYFEEYTKATLITNDIGMKIKAMGLGIKTKSYYEEMVLPECCLEIKLNDWEYETFINEPYALDLTPGQYLIIKNKEGQTKKILKYLGEGLYDDLHMDGIGNYLFQVKAKDDYQKCVIDSLYKDRFTVITGPAGTGKTLMSLSYCLQKAQSGAKIHIFVNPVKTRGAEELGFYPGDRDEKLLQNFIGAILQNKIGDMFEVNRLIESGALNLYPFSDIRGIEIAEGDIMYITEAQNLSVDLIKLAIQRCAEGSKIIIEGDPFTQVDKEAFANEGSGLKRVIQVFSGEYDFAHIHLPNIYRSKMAEIAEKL